MRPTAWVLDPTCDYGGTSPRQIALVRANCHHMRLWTDANHPDHCLCVVTHSDETTTRAYGSDMSESLRRPSKLSP